MKPETFIEQYKNDTSKTTLLDIVYGELVEYCRENDITEDEITTEQLESIAEQISNNKQF